METSVKKYKKDNLYIEMFDTSENMGKKAAADTAKIITQLLDKKETVRMIFAAAPSQNEFLKHLVLNKEIDFSRIIAFHMDEYISLPADAPQGFGNFLRERIFSRVSFKHVHYLDGNAKLPEVECARYAELLREEPIDIVCMGIGENAHIAFNDPPGADFDDPCTVKIVRLEEACRRQQVNDGCFSRLLDVPTHALTLTIPALTNVGAISCIVPGPTKKDAVYNILNGNITDLYPASILRRCDTATLYLDAKSGEYVEKAILE